MTTTIKNYEKKYAALESIVQTLDRDDLSINELLINYRKGLVLVKECTSILENVEDEIQQIIEEVKITE